MTGDDFSGTLSFPAIRGIQAKREFYSIMCTFATIYNHFKFNEDPKIPTRLKTQRKLRENRIPDIANYILNNDDNYVFSSITVSVGQKVTFNPVVKEGSDSKIGTLVVPLDAPILVNDGQHRVAAIKSVYEQNPKLGSERISVVVFPDRGLKRSQQIFADLNKHATKPTKSLGLLYDHRDAFSRFVVTLADDVEIFYGRTEMERTNISNRSTKFFTLNGIAEATKQLLKLNTKSISSEKQKFAVDYWTRISRNIPEWNLLLEKKVTPHELRKDFVHAHTNILNALGMVGYIITKNDDWKQRLKKLQKLDWHKSSPIWQDKVVMDGKMIKNRLGIKRAANTILEHLGTDERIGEVKT